jgi:HTH-type transcriptional regulator/antitoxin HigA
MEIRPIKNEADYDAALARIDALFDAGVDTPEGDELDILVTLVEAYEAKHYPVDSPDPIEVIKFRMEQRKKGSA